MERCRHFEDVFVEELASKLSRRLGNGGTQEAHIADSLGSTVLSYLTGVNFQNVVDVEELGVQSASSLNDWR